ncbi:MAG: hypothetical protein DRG31_01175 [Deltaproteobacteria bacterium]|nr:MAG: hypothetical protein DRG31_01175 [Deltaproteobacteria bacterium]
MTGMSTAWAMKNGAKAAGDLLGPLEKIGLEALELDFRVTGRILKELMPKLKAKNPCVLSLHNFCPVPDILPPEKASGDAFNLASDDPEERREAVRWTIRTLEVASELEAQVVVLHLGFIPQMKPIPHDLYRKGELTEDALADFLKERSRKAQRYLDCLLRSLEPVLKRAEALGVRVGIENRYYLHEFPLADEIGLILGEFRGAPLGYWHDTGHAHVLERLGVIGHRELLERYRADLLGVHLHDARGLDDHKPPGKGEVDFQMVRELLPQRAIRILEIHPPATEGEIREALEFLREKGLHR